MSILLGLSVCLGGILGRSRPAAAETPDDSPEVLFLIAERVVSASGETEHTRFWWSNPSDPQWTETDRRLMTALDDHGIDVLKPTGETRVSRIYRRPTLSTHNAAALASILGARRIVVGDVTYQRVRNLAPVGLTGVASRASLKVIDVTASDPEVLREYQLGRSVYSSHSSSSTSSTPLERARARLTPPVAQLLAQTLSIVSGEVGIQTDESLLTFHGLERGAALEAIRRVLGELGPVESTGVRWAAEGVVALELNPGRPSKTSLVQRAAKVLRSHEFGPLRLEPRRAGERSKTVRAFDVRITGTFRSNRQKSRRDGSSRGETP